ncbi:MAG: copper resistance protein B [Proteobacteria bacterium]|nr:copper resistance protein B [Pseudomonadota bacterium]
MRPLVLTAAFVLAASGSAWSQSIPGMPNMPGMTHPASPPHHPPAPHPPAHHHTPPAAAGQTQTGAQPQSAPQAETMPGMTMAETPAEETVGNEPAPAAPTDHAADRYFDPAIMAHARDELRHEHGGTLISKVMLNLGEYQFRNGEDGYRWEGEAWIGGDIDRFVLKSEGEGSRSSVDAAEVQALYSRAIGPYFNLQAGVRHDFDPGRQRTYAALGVEGVAPYWFDVNAALFVSDHGDVLGRLEGTYDLRLTQKLILQPRVEANLSANDAPEIGAGRGLSGLETGLRLRYEIRREFAPYVGVSFDRKFNAAADFARARGEDPSQTSFVVGIRAWF